jgi:predicted Rdx family selenoprotein
MLRARFGEAVSTELVPGGRGVFDVDAAGRRLFSKHQVHRFPDADEVEARLAELLANP